MPDRASPGAGTSVTVAASTQASVIAGAATTAGAATDCAAGRCVSESGLAWLTPVDFPDTNSGSGCGGGAGVAVWARGTADACRDSSVAGAVGPVWVRVPGGTPACAAAPSRSRHGGPVPTAGPGARATPADRTAERPRH